MSEPDVTPAAPPAAPATVYDAHYARVVNVDPAQAQADPTRFQPVANQPVQMIGPDGNSYPVPASRAQAARDEGWQWPADEQSAHAGRVGFYREHYGGAFQVGVHEALNQLTAGVQSTMEEKELPPELQEAYEAENKEHRVAQVIGGGAGALALTAATAGLGEALSGGRAVAATARAAGAADGLQAGRAAIEAGAPGTFQRMAAATARSAMEGAAMASPEAAAHLAYQDYDKAGESILWGAGIGGLLGLGHGLYSEAATAAKGAVGAAHEKALASAAEHGLVGEGGALDLTKLGIATPEKAAEARAAASKALSEHGAILDKAIADLPGSRALELDGARIVPTELADKVGSTLAETRPGLTLPAFENTEAKKATEDAVKKIAELGSQPITFGKLQELRSSLLEGALGSTERARVLRQVDRLIETEQTRAMSQAYNQLPLKADYGNYLADLGKMQQAMGLANQLGAPSAAQQWLAGKAVGAVSKFAGGAIGGGIGGAIAGPAGAWIGSKAVTPLLNRVLDHALMPKALELSGGALQKIARATPQSFGAAFAKDAVQAVDRKISGLGRALTQGAATNGADIYKAVLGHQANGLSKDQQYDKVSAAVQRAGADPSAVQQEAAHVSGVFGQDPRLGALVAQKQLAAVQYLHQSLPKPPPPKPFEAAQTHKPTPAEKAAFGRRLEVSVNPMSVMDHVVAGDLAPEHVEALHALYPSLHQAMISEVARMASDPSTPEISSGVRHGLAVLTGVNLTNPTGVNYQPQQQQGGGGAPLGPPPGGKPKGHKSGGKMNLPSTQTGPQRIAFK